MQILLKIAEVCSRTPDWLICSLPLLTAASAAVCAPFKRRGLYAAAATIVGGVFFSLAAAKNVGAACVAGGAYLAFAALCSLLFLLPAPKKRKKERGEKMKKEGKADPLYEKYRPEMPLPAPPKVLCYETPVPMENDMRLNHAEELLKRLSRCKLSPADRLETEAVSRMFDRFKGRKLDDADLRSLNDALSSVLKLTAKYKL